MNIFPDSMYLSGERHTVNSKDIAFIFKPCIDILDIGSTVVKPRYNVGDQLWVKETYYALGYWEKTGELTKTGKEQYCFIDLTLEKVKSGYKYQTNSEIPTKVLGSRVLDIINGKLLWFKRNSMFMPKKAARIWLECTGVRCERLQNITEADAIAEGVLKIPTTEEYKDVQTWENGAWSDFKDVELFKNYISNSDDVCFSAIESFSTLWMELGGRWLINPWVFIYEFKRIEKP